MYTRYDYIKDTVRLGVKVLSIAEFSSPEFDQFLDLLGDKVDLLGWEQFKGGLDTKSKVSMRAS